MVILLPGTHLAHPTKPLTRPTVRYCAVCRIAYLIDVVYNMPPGAATRGLSLCYALLVNAAAGTMRRPLILATNTASGSTAPSIATAAEPSYRRCRRPHADVKTTHVPSETVLHHDDDRAAGSIRSRYRATTPITTGFAINTALAASTGCSSRINGMRSPSDDDMILRRPVRQARSTAGGRTTPRPRVPRARNAWVRMLSACSAGIDAFAPSSGVFSARAMCTAAAGNVDGDSGQRIMKVTLLSGFLGAGKTTLMQKVLRQAREQHISLAVIVNDMVSHSTICKFACGINSPRNIGFSTFCQSCVDSCQWREPSLVDDVVAIL